MIRSPLAVTVGHGLTGPPCPVGESVPCSSGLLIPWLRMTGHKRRPFIRGRTALILKESKNPAPFRVVVFRVHTIDRGYLAGHAHTLAVVMAWKYSHVHPFLLGRCCSLWPAHRGGLRWPLLLRLLAFWVQGSGAPLVRCPSCDGARSYPSRRVRQMTCLSNPIEISKNRWTLYSSARVGVSLSRGVSPSDTNKGITVPGMTSGAP